MAEVEAFIDGASRGNPGESGFGAVLKRGSRKARIYGYLGKQTNNIAEYMALIAALTYAEEKKIKKLEVYADSELLVKQVRGEYKIRNPRLKVLGEKIRELIGGLETFSISHVPRKENKDADKLANRAIDEKKPSKLLYMLDQ